MINCSSLYPQLLCLRLFILCLCNIKQWPSSWLHCRHTAALRSTSTCRSVCNSVFVFVLFPEFGLSWPEGESAQEVSAISLCVHIKFFSPQLKQMALFTSYRVHRKRVLSQQKARPSVTIMGHFCYDCGDLMLDAEVIRLRRLDIFTFLSNAEFKLIQCSYFLCCWLTDRTGSLGNL